MMNEFDLNIPITTYNKLHIWYPYQLIRTRYFRDEIHLSRTIRCPHMIFVNISYSAFLPCGFVTYFTSIFFINNQKENKLFLLKYLMKIQSSI